MPVRKWRPITLTLHTEYLTPEGRLEVLAAEQMPDGRTKVWLRLVRPGGSVLKETREFSHEDLQRIARENREARRGTPEA